MATATELVRRFGGNPDNVQVQIGNHNGWGWADVVLANQLPKGHNGNPYEYGAYDLIRDDWPNTCIAVERDERGADARLRELLHTYRNAMVTRVTLDISIDPVDMEVGDDILDKSAVLAAIREVATETWPGASIRFKTLQVGSQQGDGWAKCWIDGVRNDKAAEDLLQSIDWTDEELYE